MAGFLMPAAAPVMKSTATALPAGLMTSGKYSGAMPIATEPEVNERPARRDTWWRISG